MLLCNGNNGGMLNPLQPGLMETLGCLLSYIGEVLGALKRSSSDR